MAVTDSVGGKVKPSMRDVPYFQSPNHNSQITDSFNTNTGILRIAQDDGQGGRNAGILRVAQDDGHGGGAGG